MPVLHSYGILNKIVLTLRTDWMRAFRKWTGKIRSCPPEDSVVPLSSDTFRQGEYTGLVFVLMYD